ncbi:MAG: alcohol dehydrogenase catalytic domain-containing protein [Planctomycetota bacterium]
MKAIVLDSDGLTYRSEWPEPVPKPGEVIVDVLQAGICETDLQLARGYMGFSGVLGHEFVGIAQSGLYAGQRVVGEINCYCRDCPMCRDGLMNHCPNRTVVGIDRHDGAFAERLAIPEFCLHAVPDAISNDHAVLTEPLAAAFQIGEQINLSQCASALVLGDGRLSLLIAQVLKHSVGRLIVIGKHAGKLSRFEERGIPTVGLAQFEPRKEFDLVVEVTGSPSGLPLALQCVRPRGTVVMKTTVANDHQLPMAALVIDEIQLVGSRCGPFDKALKSLCEDGLQLDDFVTHRFTLAEAENAMQKASEPQALKVVFDIGS